MKQEYPKMLYRNTVQDTKIVNSLYEEEMAAEEDYGCYDIVILGMTPEALAAKRKAESDLETAETNLRQTRENMQAPLPPKKEETPEPVKKLTLEEQYTEETGKSPIWTRGAHKGKETKEFKEWVRQIKS